ncbi:hypothetical protein DsansV1_C11g0109681 [Dioscorea sansibarensis]
MFTTQAMKRIPLIKFPQRHPKPSSGAFKSTEQFEFSPLGSSSKEKTSSPTGQAPSYRFKSDVPAAPSNTAVGGKASLLPKRTPVSEKEIEAILVSGVPFKVSEIGHKDCVNSLNSSATDSADTRNY